MKKVEVRGRDLFSPRTLIFHITLTETGNTVLHPHQE